MTKSRELITRLETTIRAEWTQGIITESQAIALEMSKEYEETVKAVLRLEETIHDLRK